MRKFTFISILCLLCSATCKKVSESSDKIQKNNLDYCTILDSLKSLSIYDYNLVKDKTKIFRHPSPSSIKDTTYNYYRKQGFRVVILGTDVMNLTKEDSIQYTKRYYKDASQILLQRISDSILGSTGVKPDLSTVYTILGKKVHNHQCK